MLLSDSIKRKGHIDKVSKKEAEFLEPDELKDLVVNTLDNDKAEDIVAIDLSTKTSIADYMVIASGSSSRQVTSLAEKLAIKLKENGYNSRIEGKQGGDWVLLDAGDIIVHIFRPEVREFYAIEDIWNVSYPSDKVLPS